MMKFLVVNKNNDAGIGQYPWPKSINIVKPGQTISLARDLELGNPGFKNANERELALFCQSSEKKHERPLMALIDAETGNVSANPTIVWNLHPEGKFILTEAFAGCSFLMIESD